MPQVQPKLDEPAAAVVSMPLLQPKLVAPVDVAGGSTADAIWCFYRKFCNS